MALSDSSYVKQVSISTFEVAETEWQKGPLLIVADSDGTPEIQHKPSLLQIYLIHDIATGSTGVPTKSGQGFPSVLPKISISPIHLVRCLVSMGRTAVTGGYDATVRLWDIIRGECHMVLMGHANTGKLPNFWLFSGCG